MAASWPETVREASAVVSGKGEGPPQGPSSWETVGLTCICGVGLNPQMSV